MAQARVRTRNSAHARVRTENNTQARVRTENNAQARVRPENKAQAWVRPENKAQARVAPENKARTLQYTNCQRWKLDYSSVLTACFTYWVLRVLVVLFVNRLKIKLYTGRSDWQVYIHIIFNTQYFQNTTPNSQNGLKWFSCVWVTFTFVHRSLDRSLNHVKEQVVYLYPLKIEDYCVIDVSSKFLPQPFRICVNFPHMNKF